MTDDKTDTSKVITSDYTDVSSFIFIKAQNEQTISELFLITNQTVLMKLELRDSTATFWDMQSIQMSHSAKSD